MKQDKLNISIREERPEDYRRVEEITKEAFSYPGRIEQDGITDCNGANYPAFMAMELQQGYLSNARGGKYYESDIYNDEKNRKSVMEFDRHNYS